MSQIEAVELFLLRIEQANSYSRENLDRFLDKYGWTKGNNRAGKDDHLFDGFDVMRKSRLHAFEKSAGWTASLAEIYVRIPELINTPLGLVVMVIDLAEGLADSTLTKGDIFFYSHDHDYPYQSNSQSFLSDYHKG